MSDLIHLIYNSAAVRPFTEAELAALLDKARNKNAASNVTGMLLHVEGTFFQVLEGAPADIDALAATIAADPRHARMTTIIREPIARRSFSEWTMGFSQMSRSDALSVEGLNDFFQTGQVLDAVDGGRAKKLLQAFKQGRWRVRLTANAPTAVATLAPLDQPREAGTTADAAAVAARPAPTDRPAFTFAFQPIVDADQRRVIGYEALVRGLGQEPAADVLQRVPLEDITEFDEDARRVAIGLASRLGLRSQLHLNVMPHTRMGSPQTLDSTLDTARRCGLDPARIVLEIKHEATINDPRSLAAWLRPYRSEGVRISIDDFGSGHAGLALLDHYQPEAISLSMWLVRSIEGHGPRQAILRGLVQTCNDLGIDIIAKGVETTDEYAWLRDEGITLFQGYLFARPGYESLPRPMLPAELA
jgi:EAL domain-containing protein (putative c-di-GMP-specific phosphodiesterase class I)